MSETAKEVIAARCHRWAGIHRDGLADAIIDDLDAAGFVIVPKETAETVVKMARTRPC